MKRSNRKFNLSNSIDLGMQELWVNKFKLLSIFIVALLLVAVTISLLSFAFSIPQKLKEQLHEDYSDGPAILVNRVTVDKLTNKKILTSDITDVDLGLNNNDSISFFEKARLSFNNTLIRYPFSIDAPFIANFINNSTDTINYFLVEGEKFQDKKHNIPHEVYPIWITKTFKDDNIILLGDHLDLEIGGKVYKLRVDGIINPSEERESGYLIKGDIFYPFSFLLKITKVLNLPVSMNGFLNIKVDAYDKAIENLEKNYIWLSRNEFFEMQRDSFYSYSTLLYALAILSVVVSMVIVYNLFQMLVSSRNRYIGILKALGMGNMKISLVYFVALLFMMVLTVPASWAISKGINIFLSKDLGFVFGTSKKIIVDIPFIIPLLTLVAIIIILLLCFIKLNILVKKVNVMDVLIEKD